MKVWGYNWLNEPWYSIVMTHVVWKNMCFHESLRIEIALYNGILLRKPFRDEMVIDLDYIYLSFTTQGYVVVVQ